MCIPLKYLNDPNLERLFDYNTVKVGVQYCVLRPKEKINT